MATDLKRFTISITPTMEKDLDALKQRKYYSNTRNDLIRDLIVLGLKALNAAEASEDVDISSDYISGQIAPKC